MSTHRISLTVDSSDQLAARKARHVLAHAPREALETCASRVHAETGRGGGRSAGTAGPLRSWTNARITPSRKEFPSADEQLLGVVAADPSALGLLYDRYAKLVYGLALAILRSREEAEDVTQEVFVSLCEPTSYDPDRGTVSAFLTTMTRSRAIDRLRRRGRSARLVKTWHEAAATPAPRTPFEHLSMRRTAERVRAVLAELPRAQRQVLEMAYYKGLSQREIAADLDTPLGTVKSRARRALTTLGRALEDFVA